MAIVLFGCSMAASAAEVSSAKFDPVTNDLTVEVSYGGGCKQHNFKLDRSGGCLESNPVQCTMKIVETVVAGPDLCEALIRKTLLFKAEETGLDDSYFDGAFIKIKGSNNSVASVVIERKADNSEPKGQVICPTTNGKFVKFLPAFGEVHFLNADGTEWRQHHDGLSIEVLVLESNPPQINATITDDEGNKVGGWKFKDNATTFDVNYLAKTYRNCREIWPVANITLAKLTCQVFHREGEAAPLPKAKVYVDPGSGPSNSSYTFSTLGNPKPQSGCAVGELDLDESVVSSDKIHLECGDDGEAGRLSLKLVNKDEQAWEGSIIFPNGDPDRSGEFPFGERYRLICEPSQR